MRRGRSHSNPGRMRPGDGGFTLFEVAVSLAVASVVFVIISAAVGFGVSSLEKGSASVALTSERRAVMSRLSDDMASAYPYRLRKDGDVPILFSGGPDAVGFVTASRRDFSHPWGGAARVHYSVDDAGLGVSEQTLPASGKTPWRKTVIGPSIRAVSFEYLGEGGWVRHWDGGALDSLPLAVRARFAMKGGREALSIVIPVNAGARARRDERL